MSLIPQLINGKLDADIAVIQHHNQQRSSFQYVCLLIGSDYVLRDIKSGKLIGKNKMFSYRGDTNLKKLLGRIEVRTYLPLLIKF